MSDIQMKAGQFCWNELITHDVAKAKEFYGSLLGWEYEDIDMGEFTYTMFKNGEQQIGGMMQIPKDKTKEIPPHWMSYILVEDITQSLEKAKKLGAVIKMPITQVSDSGKFTVLADPTGAHIALWQSLKTKDSHSGLSCC